MARPTPRPKEKKKLDRLLANLHGARTAVWEAEKLGGNVERAQLALRRAWSAVHSHCDRHDLPLPTDSADDPFRPAPARSRS